MKAILYPMGVVVGLLVSSLLLPVTMATDMDDDYVTCGSAIKLTNMESGDHYLSSAQHKINSGSNQQLVTSSPSRSDSDLLWIISAGHGTPACDPGTKIGFGSKIRFTHVNTGSNLHSHLYKSPLTQNQEVTGFGDAGTGDAGDNWIVRDVRSSGAHWERGNPVIITHADTGKNLGSSKRGMFTRNNCGNRCPVMDHLEVFAASGSSSYLHWKAELGVFLSL